MGFGFNQFGSAEFRVSRVCGRRIADKAKGLRWVRIGVPPKYLYRD